MSDTEAHAGEEVNYLAVFGGLIALTAAEVGVTYMGLPKMGLLIALLGTALAKALLIALYFMHLRWENLLILSLFIIPMVLGALLIIGLTPDIVYGYPW